MKRIILIVLMAVLTCAFCFAQNTKSYYVSAKGNDDNDGLSEAKPLKNLSTAVEKMMIGNMFIPDTNNWITKITVIGTLNSDSKIQEDAVVFGLNNMTKIDYIITGKSGATSAERAVLSAKGTNKAVLAVRGFFCFENIEISGGTGKDPAPAGILLTTDYTFVTLNTGAVVRDNKGIGITIGDGYLVIDGGEVRNNEGTGVALLKGELIMESGAIRDNKSISHSGGVYVSGAASFTMSGGIITGNKAAEAGGGVSVVTGGRFDQTGGSISSNTALRGGNDVFRQSGSLGSNLPPGSSGSSLSTTTPQQPSSGSSSSSSSTSSSSAQTTPKTESTTNTVSPPVTKFLEGFVFIKGGTFTMGSPEREYKKDMERYRFSSEVFYKEVQHKVTVSSFFMGKYEVTQLEYQDVMGTNPSIFKGNYLPVENITWYNAIDYCNKRSQNEGLTPAYTRNGDNVTWNKNANGYRLPTEAEWEYACRAGRTTRFNTGINIKTSQANYNGNDPNKNNAIGIYREKTTAVGSFAPNAWGLYDMHGNVWEWCWDWYGEYPSKSQIDPVGASSGDYRVARGGSWFNNVTELRSAMRAALPPLFQGTGINGGGYGPGFRLARNAQ